MGLENAHRFGKRSRAVVELKENGCFVVAGWLGLVSP